MSKSEANEETKELVCGDSGKQEQFVYVYGKNVQALCALHSAIKTGYGGISSPEAA